MITLFQSHNVSICTATSCTNRYCHRCTWLLTPTDALHFKNFLCAIRRKRKNKTPKTFCKFSKYASVRGKFIFSLTAFLLVRFSKLLQILNFYTLFHSNPRADFIFPQYFSTPTVRITLSVPIRILRKHIHRECSRSCII